MQINPKLESGILLKRYKRFLADISIATDKTIIAHCPNTGSMKNCIASNSLCWFSTSDNPKRKLAQTLEITTAPSGHYVGVNTHRANALVEEAILNGLITPLQGYPQLRREVRYGNENSRIDFLLEKPKQRCYVEVKNTTFEIAPGVISFPDAKTTRGEKHLRELMAMKAEGHRAVLIFCVQHNGATQVAPEASIDPDYYQTLLQAHQAGVEIFAYACHLSPSEIAITHPLPFILEQDL